MNAKKTTRLGAALCALAGLAMEASAATPAYLNIDVTFNNAMSVAVDAVNSSTYTTAWTSANQELLSASSATVSNDSIVTERWKLYTNANSLAPSGSAWALAASTSAVGADEFSLQAVFGSSNTAAGGCSAATAGGTWNVTARAPLLATSFAAGQQYTSAGALASPDLVNNGLSTPDVGTNGGSMYGGMKRALCWRVIAPQSTVATQTQNIQVIVAAY